MIETSATLGSDFVGRWHTMQRFSEFCDGMQPLHPPPAESEAVVLGLRQLPTAESANTRPMTVSTRVLGVRERGE